MAKKRPVKLGFGNVPYPFNNLSFDSRSPKYYKKQTAIGIATNKLTTFAMSMNLKLPSFVKRGKEINNKNPIP
ncbi:MAG: hypothetical protein SGI94_11830 [Saprospiraceae bacterium]|nr:hypothetical protein [Saprospiraceae bacterium]